MVGIMDVREAYAGLVAPHVESFNRMMQYDLDDAINSIPKVRARVKHNDGSETVVNLWLRHLRVQRPTHEGMKRNAFTNENRNMLPRECREMMSTYAGGMSVEVHRSVTHYAAGASGRAKAAGSGSGDDSDDGDDDSEDDVVMEDVGVSRDFPKPLIKRIGHLPIMVNSSKCNLQNLRDCGGSGSIVADLVRVAKEHDREVGGYFIINGIEKVVRLLIMQRRHHILAVRRDQFAKRGDGFTEFAVSMRCVNSRSFGDDDSVDNGGGDADGDGDQEIRERNCMSRTVRCHYMENGDAVVHLRIRRAEYHIPVGVILRALSTESDEEIFSKLVGNCAGDFVHSGNAPRRSEEKQEKRREGSSKHDEERYSFTSLRAELIMQSTLSKGIATRQQALEYLGRLLKGPMEADEHDTDAKVGERFINRHVFCHLGSHQDKLMLLSLMMKKLWMFVRGECCEDNTDSLDNQELLLPGQLLTMVICERFQYWLSALSKQLVATWNASNGGRAVGAQKKIVEFGDDKHMQRVLDQVTCDVGTKVQYMLATGNLVSNSGLELGQTSGFTVVAERLNYLRYIAHFRSVHRGAYFAQMRTTTVRKLLPESYGFMCPVHTPDGSPCGLLLHLCQLCKLVTGKEYDDEHELLQPSGGAATLREYLVGLLLSLGMRGSNDALAGLTAEPNGGAAASLNVMIDGQVVGSLYPGDAEGIVSVMRAAKRTSVRVPKAKGGDDGGAGIDEEAHGVSTSAMQPPAFSIPWHVEFALIPYSKGGPFPGLFVFTQPSRMMRPVVPCMGAAADRGCPVDDSSQDSDESSDTESREVEYIGSLEQLFMHISCHRTGGAASRRGDEDGATHTEIAPTSMLSLVASLTPWSDYNQSPRNMYQCQMAKQTMGTPCHNFRYNTDTKMYRLNTPQRPISRTANHHAYNIDDFAMGTNAVVAVLSYTGYDMEDAMIINKASMERGFAHATLYKSSSVDVADGNDVFAPAAIKQPSTSSVGEDGLPAVGSTMRDDDAIYCSRNTETNRTRAKRHAGESAVVESVTIMGDTRSSNLGESNVQRANIKMRFNRNPVIGDKFASRHGQKGVLSQLWPDADMPFSASTGMRPDIIINPHAFPSRMTIGMLIESLASKAGALTGTFQDCTPFQDASSSAKEGEGSAYDDVLGGGVVSSYGEQLASCGFNYYGSETMISGVTGEEFRVDTFIGLVYYQRLRHMVSDKFQVRAEGPNNPLYRQPLKGRKQGGGIRVGEMERDALLAHGVSALVQDRLHLCSDYHTTYVCSLCGSIVSTSAAKATSIAPSLPAGRDDRVQCLSCKTSSGIGLVSMPYVMKYLTSELCAMNIRTIIDVKSKEEMVG